MRSTEPRLRPAANTPLRTLLGALPLVCTVAVLGASPARAAGSSSYFTPLPNPLTSQRGDAIAAPLPDGQILIAGGQDTSGLLASAELFNPTDNTFTKLEGPEQQTAVTRQGAAAATLPGGEVLIAGGSYYGIGDLSSSELFDPITDTFTKLEGPGSEMTIGREHPLAATLPDGDVLIAGGSAEVESGPFPFPIEEVVSSAELFDPITDTFTKLEGPGSETAVPRWGPATAVLHDGEVLIAGGRYQGSAELFDPSTDTFTKLEGPGREMVESRQGATATTLGDGDVLIVGGLHNTTNLSDAELFDPTTDTFTKLEGPGSSLPEVREFAVAAPLPDGRILIAGGVNEHGWLSEADVFFSAAQASIVGYEFGAQTVGSSRSSMLVVTNLGAQRLSISDAAVEGADQSDWTIAGDGCSGHTLSYAQSCAISLLFDPAQEGSRQATLKLADNEASKASVTTLTGTGVPANQGPAGPEGKSGSTGEVGPQGQSGADGAAGPAGATGATGAVGTPGAKGPRGPAGQVELIVCTHTKTKRSALAQRCQARPGTSPFRFAGQGRKLAVTVYRGRRLYAKGFELLTADGDTQLLLDPARRLPGGHYTLAIEDKHKQRRVAVTVVG